LQNAYKTFINAERTTDTYLYIQDGKGKRMMILEPEDLPAM